MAVNEYTNIPEPSLNSFSNLLRRYSCSCTSSLSIDFKYGVFP